MKDNIDFYQHYADSDQHPKFKMLRIRFGWEGEGKFWALNNRIALSSNCYLDISKKYVKAAVAEDLGFKLDEFNEFIQYLLVECELVYEAEHGVITTDIVQENFNRVAENRKKARDRKAKWLEKVSKGSPELSKGSPEKNKKGKGKGKSKGKSKENLVTEFESFWSFFNKKIDREKCYKKWEGLEQEEKEKIFNSVSLYVASTPDPQFRKNPLTWLNGKCWNDEIVIKDDINNYMREGYHNGKTSTDGKDNGVF